MTSAQDTAFQSAAQRGHVYVESVIKDSAVRHSVESTVTGQSGPFPPSQQEATTPTRREYASLVTSGNARVHAGDSYNNNYNSKNC